MLATSLARILIVDDEAASMRALCETLRDQGYDTAGFTAGAAALQALRERPYDLLLTDLMMPDEDGVELLKQALGIDPQLAGILMTGMGTIETAVQAMKAGAHDYVLKPIKLSTLLPVLSRAVAFRRLRLENMELRDTVAIQELNQAIAHTLDPKVLLDKIADAALAQFEADEASVMLLTEDGGSLYVAAVRGEQRDALLGSRLSLGEGVAGWVACRCEPLDLQGEVADPRVAPVRPRPDIQSALSMPMMTRNKLIGVLNVNCIRRRRSFTLGQIKVLSIFANAAAASIEAAHLYEREREADARYREVLQMAADGIVSLDDEQRIVIFNAGAEALFGYRADEVIGRPLAMLLPEAAAARHADLVRDFGRGPDQARAMAGRGNLFARRKDGELVNIEVGISRHLENARMHFTAVVRDVTQRIRQEERIERLTRLYAVLSGVNAAIVRILDEAELYAEICRVAVEQGLFKGAWVGTLDPDKREIVLVASAGAKIADGKERLALAAAGRDSLIARSVREAHIVYDNDLASRPQIGYLRQYSLALGARAGAALPFVRDGAVRAIMVLHADAADAFGEEELRLLRELAGDVSFALDHIAKTRHVEYLATRDQVTGLPNRSLFLDRLAQALVAAKDKREPMALVFTDIERFKQVNDSYGRQAGDALLRQMAGRLQTLVGDGASLARVGADVFAAIVTGMPHAAGVDMMVRTWNDEILAEPFLIEQQPLNIALRSAIALFPADGADAEALFNNAEAALKRARASRERLIFYTADINARVAEELALASRLRRALERNEFLLHYQPKVDLATGAIVGLEALIRWQDPQTGLVPPGKFIGLLEETGLILEVGRWAMKEAARTAVALRAEGLPPLRIAVNVSPLQLREKEFVRSVETAIAAAGPGPHGLDLEITESVLMHDIEENARKLHDLCGMDVELAIDDFGTGYSSLSYIARLPIHTLKIDRAFIIDLATNPGDLSIVSSIISLAHSLKLKVVAEGVETMEQAARLRQLGCDQLQGYLFSRPVPQQQIEVMLREGRSLPGNG